MSQEKRHWSTIGETGTILGMKLLLLMYRIFGRRVFQLILIPVIGYYYLRNRYAREASKQYLALLSIFIEPSERAQLKPFKHFLMFGEVILDKFLVWMGKIGRADVIFETPGVLGRLDKNKKGGVIIVSHLGNIEVCNALGQQLPDIRFTLLVNTAHAEKFNSLMERLNSNSRVKVLQVQEMSPATAIVLSERIAEGEYIVIAGDRTPATGQARVSAVNFLGERASMPQGAFILASLLKCPVYLMFCLKQESQYHIYVELFAEQLKIPRKQRQEVVTKMVQAYASRLGFYCTKAPLQWFNFFPFWEDGNRGDTDARKNE